MVAGVLARGVGEARTRCKTNNGFVASSAFACWLDGPISPRPGSAGTPAPRVPFSCVLLGFAVCAVCVSNCDPRSTACRAALLT